MNSFLLDDIKSVPSSLVKNISAVKLKQGPLIIISSMVTAVVKSSKVFNGKYLSSSPRPQSHPLNNLKESLFFELLAQTSKSFAPGPWWDFLVATPPSFPVLFDPSMCTPGCSSRHERHPKLPGPQPPH